MAKQTSEAKRHKQNLKKRIKNRHIRATVRSAVKDVLTAIEENLAQAPDKFQAAASTLGKAASKGVLHKKTASRRVSRLAKAISKASKASTT